MGRLSSVINYAKINEANKEFRRSDYWLVDIDPPKGIYFPGNDLIQIRTSQFSPGITDDPEVLEKTIRTFTIKQGAKPTNIAGELSITLTDRVDQTISYFIDQWKLALGDRDSLSSLPKEEYTAKTITATYYNINEQPIRRLQFLNCMIKTGGLPEDGGSDPGIEEDITLSISYEHFKRVFDNLPLV